MWHVAVLLLGLLGLPASAQAQFYSEGGARNPSYYPENNELEGSLENIVDELQQFRQAQLKAQEQQLYDQEVPVDFQQPEYTVEEPIEQQQPQNLGQLLDQLQNGQLEQQEQQQQLPEEKEVKTPQKKGQFEFVEFVEPHSKALKNIEFMDKRAPVTHIERPAGLFNLFGNSGNVVFIAVVTMCCVFSVVGVVGGAYYFNNVRKQRAEMFDDFTRYSPAGPGRDILRKGRGFAGSPVAETGDDSLAYKAQLHHYQQTKQKIIGDEGIHDDHSDKSEDEADDLEEHNFSVYECPGLAPTGDIEVQNPNFSQNP